MKKRTCNCITKKSKKKLQIVNVWNNYFANINKLLTGQNALKEVKDESYLPLFGRLKSRAQTELTRTSLHQQRTAMHHHNENESFLLSFFVFSSFVLCLLFRLLLSLCLRFERTHGAVLDGHTEGGGRETKGLWWSSSVELTEICPQRVITFFRGHQKQWILPILRMGRGQHIPCTVLLDVHYTKQEGPRTRTTTTTTCRQQHTTQHHPPHPTTPTTRGTRHATAPHNRKHEHAHVNLFVCECVLYVYVYVCACACHGKTQSGTRTYHDVFCPSTLTSHNG